METQYIGSEIYDKVKSDPRVTPDLRTCLYCEISTEGTPGYLPYRITLDSISPGIKACPACGRVYLLQDPI